MTITAASVRPSRTPPIVVLVAAGLPHEREDQDRRRDERRATGEQGVDDVLLDEPVPRRARGVAQVQQVERMPRHHAVGRAAEHDLVADRPGDRRQARDHAEDDCVAKPARDWPARQQQEAHAARWHQRPPGVARQHARATQHRRGDQHRPTRPADVRGEHAERKEAEEDV
jgi:hypothetical protein